MSNTTTLTMALLIILCVDGFLLLGSVAMTEINPDSATTFFTYEGSFIESYDGGNYTITGEYLEDNTPEGASSVSPETDNEFTDTFKSIKTWFGSTTVGKGVSYGFRILGAPMGFLTIINAPPVITYVIGAIWYGITFFLLVMVMFGRN